MNTSNRQKVSPSIRGRAFLQAMASVGALLVLLVPAPVHSTNAWPLHDVWYHQFHLPKNNVVRVKVTTPHDSFVDGTYRHKNSTTTINWCPASSDALVGHYWTPRNGATRPDCKFGRGWKYGGQGKEIHKGDKTQVTVDIADSLAPGKYVFGSMFTDGDLGGLAELVHHDRGRHEARTVILLVDPRRGDDGEIVH